MVFEALEERGIVTVVKPRRGSRSDTRSPARGRAVEEFLGLGYKA